MRQYANIDSMKDKDKKPDRVRTTVTFDRDLWKRVKIRAVEDDCDFNSVVTQAVEIYIKAKRKKGGER